MCPWASPWAAPSRLPDAKMVIAQVNDQMPRTMGESFLHVSQLTCCVEASTPLPELGGGTIGEVEEAIGRNVASLVEDGSTLQLGIGTIPDAVLKFLGDKKDLGIHSEMFSDGVVDLYQKGVITGANKRLDKGQDGGCLPDGLQKALRLCG